MSIRYLALLIFFLTFGFLHAQEYQMRDIPINQNDETHKIRNKIYIDDDEVLWYSTYNGIVKDFETNSILSTFLDKDEEILPTYLDVIFIDSKQRIWIVAGIGVFISDSLDDSFDKVRFRKILENENVSLGSLIEDCDGNIWAGTYNDVILKIDSSLKVTKYDTPKINREINTDYFQRNFSFVERIIDCNKILYRLGRKLYLLEDGKSTLKADHTPSLNYTSSNYLYPEWSFNGGDGLLITENGKLFPQSQNTTYSFGGAVFETHFIEDLDIQVTNLPFREMIPVYKSDTPYLKNHADLIAIDQSGKKLQFYKLQKMNGKIHMVKAHEIAFPYQIDDVVVDKYDVVYVCNYDRVSKIKFNNHTFHKILNDHTERKISARGFLELPNKEILAASYSGTFKLSPATNDFGEQTYLTEKVFPSLDYLRSFVKISDSTAWCAGENKKISEINFLDDKILGQYQFDDHWRLTHLQYYDVVRYSGSSLLIASNFGLQEFDIEQKAFKELPILPVENNSEVYVRDLLKTRERLYVATDRNGLFIKDLRSNSFKALNKNAGSDLKIPTDKVYVVFEDQAKNLWMGTDVGVIHVDKDLEEIKIIDKKDGLSDSNVIGILQDADGTMWFSTYYGLFRYDPKSEKIASFFVEDGLTFNDFNQNSYFKTSEDRMFFGGINGIVAFDSINVTHQSRKIKIFPTQFEYFDSSTDKEMTINAFNDGDLSFNLPHFKNSFSISYSINDNFNTDNNRYFYKLEGFTDDWVDMGNQTTLKLLSIPPGDYRLKIKGFNATGIESANGLSYDIHVPEVFYKILWLQILGVFFILGLLVFWGLKNAAKTRKRYALNLTLVELERKTLISQMNPHFIFNALNEIRNRLRSGKIKGLDHYVTLFSKLSRLTLDVTRNERIKLSKEIDFIKSYVDLSNIDNNSDVVLTVEYGSHIDVDKMVIPPMLLQPIIENSIVHGFDKDQASKVIVLNIEKSSVTEQLIITIEDNGLGIEASKNGKKKTQHQSYASQILKERLNLMNQINKNGKYEISFKDLAEEQGNGTRVTIKIPYIL